MDTGDGRWLSSIDLAIKYLQHRMTDRVHACFTRVMENTAKGDATWPRLGLKFGGNQDSCAS
jgi:hypothetical protein